MVERSGNDSATDCVALSLLVRAVHLHESPNHRRDYAAAKDGRDNGEAFEHGKGTKSQRSEHEDECKNLSDDCVDTDQPKIP